MDFIGMTSAHVRELHDVTLSWKLTPVDGWKTAHAMVGISDQLWMDKLSVFAYHQNLVT